MSISFSSPIGIERKKQSHELPFCLSLILIPFCEIVVVSCAIAICEPDVAVVVCGIIVVAAFPFALSEGLAHVMSTGEGAKIPSSLIS